MLSAHPSLVIYHVLHRWDGTCKPSPHELVMEFQINSWRRSQSCILTPYTFKVRKWNLEAPHCLNLVKELDNPKTPLSSFYARILSVVLESTLLYPNRTQPILQEIMGVFNRNCMIMYAAYRDIFPVWALGEYRQKLMSWACVESWTHHDLLNLARCFSSAVISLPRSFHVSNHFLLR